MQKDEKTRWNKKYSEGPRPALELSREPEPFLLDAFGEFLAARLPGTALDVAGGAGRNALWLAQRGWRVKLIDISEAGVALARENAAKMFPSAAGAAASNQPLFTAEVMDLNSHPDLGDEQYDLVVVFFYLQRELFPALIRALKPEGFLIYETYTVEQSQSGGPSNPKYLLRPDELLHAFGCMRILHYRERASGKAVAEMVAQKPKIR
ncbi:MAG TPA: class I SAM-dependent methyltransferase [Candidatus Angelobacter sp.]